MYSFNIINWTITEIRRLDSKIYTLLTYNRINHLKTDIDRFFTPSNKGGRAMIQPDLSYKASTTGQHKHLTTRTDQMLQLVLTHGKTKKAHSVSKQFYKFKQELNIHQNEENTNTSTK